MSICADIIERLQSAIDRSREWWAAGEAMADPALDWVNAPPGTVDLGDGAEPTLAALLQSVSNLGGGFDRWVYVAPAAGVVSVTLPAPVDPALTRCAINGVPLGPGDWSLAVGGAQIDLTDALEPGDWLEVRTYGG